MSSLANLDSATIDRLLADLRASRLPPSGRRRRIRQEAGASLRDIARALGVSPMTVLRWEEGVQPKRAHAIAYRQLLDALEEGGP
jgi:DNA-binding transcriptional regulator YiaG